MPRKRKPKKKHSVKANLHVLELTRAGSSLDLAIYADQEKIGTMIIGSGSLSWKGGKRQITKRIPWSRFAEIKSEIPATDSSHGQAELQPLHPIAKSTAFKIGFERIHD